MPEDVELKLGIDIQKAAKAFSSAAKAFQEVCHVLQPWLAVVNEIYNYVKTRKIHRRICWALFLNVYVLDMKYQENEYIRQSMMFKQLYEESWSPVWDFISRPKYFISLWGKVWWWKQKRTRTRFKEYLKNTLSAPGSSNYKKATECHDNMTESDKTSCHGVTLIEFDKLDEDGQIFEKEGFLSGGYTNKVKQNKITYPHESSPVKGAPARVDGNEFVVPATGPGIKFMNKLKKLLNYGKEEEK